MFSLHYSIGNVWRNFNQELRLRAPRGYDYRRGGSFAKLRMLLQLLITLAAQSRYRSRSECASVRRAR
jgi:hypothetical protein